MMEIMTREEYESLVEGSPDESYIRDIYYYYWRVGRVIYSSGIAPGLQVRVFADEDTAKRVMEMFRHQHKSEEYK